MKNFGIPLFVFLIMLDPFGCSVKSRVKSDEVTSVPNVEKTIAKKVPKESAAKLREDPYWHRKAVGGMWEEIGKLQFDFLVEQGLKPEHRFLDVGCGSLRGGIHFIKYLEAGHYFGIDIEMKLLDAGRMELKMNNLTHKNPALVRMGNFDFESLNQKFDFALAQSVFTHLPLNEIIRCIMNIDKTLVKGGRFYATIFENPAGKHNLEPFLHRLTDGKHLVSFFDKNPYHYDLKTFKWICMGTDLRVEYIGDWNHPRDQKMLVFIKE